MDKYALFSGKAEDGRPRIHLVEPGSGYGVGATDGLTKTASGEHLPQVMELIESIEAQPGRLYLVNSALGAGEYVGFNLRGDWFTEKGLNHTPPGFEDIPVWDIDARRKAANRTEVVPKWGSLAWGYPTFYNAHRFRHHVNKDPNKAYGYILGAFWDDRMKRVILVSELIKTMCARMGALDLYNRIANGEFPDSSMGSKVPYDRCFPAGTLIWTENGYQPIEDLRGGDPVHTLENLVRPVDVPMSSRFTGTLIGIRPAGLPKFETTANHPVFRIQREEVRSCSGSANGKKRRHTPGPDGTCSFCGTHLGWIPQEVPSADLRVGDYLLTPVESHGQEDPSPEMAYLMGVYAGDGFIIRQRTGKEKDGPYRNMGLGFSCNSADSHIDRVTSAISSLSNNEPRSYDEGRERQAVSIRVYDQSLAAEALRLLGEKWDSKGLRRGVFASQAARLSFLGGAIDSDGCFDQLNGNIRITTGNKALAYDLWHTCACSNIAASLYSQTSKGGFSEDTEIWVVFIPGSYSTELSEFSEKVRPVERGRSTQSFFWDGYLCSPIKSLEEREVEDFVVFNLDVEGDDETYVAAGVAVHNCSICNHHARTPMQYCEHVRKGAVPPYGMKSLLPDGRVCGVYNDYPRFFDDSFVFVGAERSAKVMSNVTDQVSGSNAYSQKTYPFVRPMPKLASAAGVEDVTPTEMAQSAPPAETSPMPDFVLEEKLTRAVQSIPTNTAVERETLRFFMQERLAEERVKTGTMSATEMQMWKDLSRNVFLRQYGVSPEQMAHLKVLFNTRANHFLGLTKEAEMPKWADILKKIPAPSAHQMSILRKEEACLPELPREILDEIACSPGPNLRAAARLGVVMRPNEFQYVMLKQRDPELADRLMSERIVFRPRPLGFSGSQFDSRSFVPSSIMRNIIQKLMPLLASRSFAPKAIRVRITKVTPMAKLAESTETSSLDEISDLYNQYRLGIMTYPPDLKAVTIPTTNFASDLDSDVKIAADSVSLSNLMMNLAYWPGLPLGLHSSAEEDSSEDAVTPETQIGEIHHVTP